MNGGRTNVVGRPVAGQHMQLLHPDSDARYAAAANNASRIIVNANGRDRDIPALQGLGQNLTAQQANSQ